MSLFFLPASESCSLDPTGDFLGHPYAPGPDAIVLLDGGVPGAQPPQLPDRGGVPQPAPSGGR